RFNAHSHLPCTSSTSNIPATVEKFRYLLRFVETPSTRSLRQFLSCQFAELLLRGLTNNTFHKYDMGPEKTPIIHTRGWVSPQRYPAHRFVPDSLMREAVLMLLISEHIASQEVILNRPSEVSDARFMHSFNNTSAVYDLLAIALARTGNFVFLSRTLEKSLKFSYREFHIWYQFALSLISARKASSTIFSLNTVYICILRSFITFPCLPFSGKAFSVSPKYKFLQRRLI
ncbi:Tetratricopeptide repeat protein 7B, partial [Fasciola gigantica]